MYSGEEIRLAEGTCSAVVHYHGDLRAAFLTAGEVPAPPLVWV